MENDIATQNTDPWHGEHFATAYSYAYDYMSRRVAKWTPSHTTTFVYDGWNLIAETMSSSAPNHYLWGLDLSGTEQGAGGIGGLLAVFRDGNWHVPLADANGNVTEYISGSSGTVVARYAYDAFGGTIAQSGPMAGAFAHRFSTKYLDTETGLYYYGRRFYDPIWGRWINRDPIEEDGGLNLYAFCGNDGVNGVDLLGETEIYVMFYGTEPSDYLPFTDGITLGNSSMDFIAWVLDVTSRYRQNDESQAKRDILTKLDVNSDRNITEAEISTADIRLLGYSWGAVTAIDVAHDLSQPKSRIGGYRLCTPVPIKRLLAIDPVTFMNTPSPVGDNVVRFRNYYQQKGGYSRILQRRRSDGGLDAANIGSWLSRRLRGSSVRNVSSKVDSRQIRIDTEWSGKVEREYLDDGIYSELIGIGSQINHDMMPWFVKWEVIRDWQ